MSIVNFAFNTAVVLYGAYKYVQRKFYSIFGDVLQVYYVPDTEATATRNLTLHYYTDCGLAKYCNGGFFLKKHNSSGTDYIAFKGAPYLIGRFRQSNIHDRPNRLNTTLLYADNPVQLDLKILDNYYKNCYLYDDPITNLGVVCKLLNIQCDQVRIVHMEPFRIELFDIDKVDIGKLYE